MGRWQRHRSPAAVRGTTPFRTTFAPNHDGSVCYASRRRRDVSCNRGNRRRLMNKMEYAVCIVLVGCVAFGLYVNTFQADFAYDDSRAIRTNQDLLPSTPLSSLFKNDFWGTTLSHSGSHKSYRPLCVLTFRLNYLWGGYNPRGYHVVNACLHVVTSVLFTVVAARLFFWQLLPTIVAGLTFATHPIHTEAVAGIVGRADVGAAILFLLSLISYTHYLRHREKDIANNGALPRLLGTKRWLWLCTAMVLAGASMLTKELGITVLAVCVVYDIFVHHKVAPSDLLSLLSSRRHMGLWEGLFHLGGAAVILLGFRMHMMGGKAPDFAPADNPAADSDSLMVRFLTFSYLPAFNFWLLLYPRWLSFDWSMESIPLIRNVFDARNLFTLIFYASFYVVISRLCRVLNFRRGTASEVVTSHYAPMPKISYKRWINNNNHLTVSPGMQYMTSYSTSGSISPCSSSCPSSASSDCSSESSFSGGSASRHLDATVVALALLVVPFLPATNIFFYVGFVIAERVLYIPSMGYCLLIAIGTDHAMRKRILPKRLLLACLALLWISFSVRTVRRNVDWHTEENLYRSGISINPPKSYGNLANILSARGNKDEAEVAYRKALSYRANMADVHYNLGILLQEQNRLEEALQSYRLAIQFRPRLAMAHLNMGLVLGTLGRKSEAIEVYRHCAALDSNGLKDPKIHESTKISALFNLGRLYADDGNYHEAIKVYIEAVSKMPEHYQPQSLYNMLGEAYFKLGNFEDAEKWYKEALKTKPDHIPAHLTYAKLLAKWNRPTEAEAMFLRAKMIAPNDSSVYQHYGQFLSESERHQEAAELYLRAVALAPDEYEIIFNAANALRQAQRNADAERFYKLAAKLRPNEVTSHMNLGAMLHVNGKLLEAEASYLEALRLRPDDAITQNNLQKLRNLLVQRGIRSSAENVVTNSRR